MLIGAEANELLLFDRDKIFSSEQGWGPALHQLFPRGLMLMDFDHHRMDRRALSIAFKPEPMRHYADALERGIVRRRSTSWGGDDAVLSGDQAADTGSGAPTASSACRWGPEADRINQAFVDMVAASVTPVRKPLPFTQMRKGVKGREYLVDYFTARNRQAPRRRRERAGHVQPVRHRHPRGRQLLPVGEMVDHMNFLMMAAHDTITSSRDLADLAARQASRMAGKGAQEVLAVIGGPDAGQPRIAV